MNDVAVSKDKVISITYIIHDQQGEIFEYSDLPIAYLHGSGSDLFDKIESALNGKHVGDKIEVELSPADGFGEHKANLTYTDDVENVPEELRQVGKQFEAQNAKGELMNFIVTGIKGENLTVDANHPLAGQTVKFTVTIKEIRDATEEELRNGMPQSPMGAASMLQ